MSYEDIFRQVDEFDKLNWAIFVRKSLLLEELEISNIDRNGGSSMEKKYQMTCKWMMKNRKTNTTEQLKRLCEQFFSESSFSSNPSSSVPILYKTDNRNLRKGLVLIICNEISKKFPIHKRNMESMVSLWNDEIGCELHGGKAHVNQTAQQMNVLIESFSKVRYEYGYAVIIISSHGNLMKKSDYKERSISPKSVACDDLAPDPVQIIQGSNYSVLAESDIFRPFCSSESTAWKNVPKFFILDYCRGEYNTHMRMDAKPMDDASISTQTVYSQSLIPTVSDFLAVYATQGMRLAYAEETGCSWLLDAIDSIFNSNWKFKSVVEMLTMVNKHMKDEKGSAIAKAMSVFESSLTSEFNLHGCSE